VTIGSVESEEDLELLHLGHPLVQAALQEAREATKQSSAVRVHLTENATEYLLSKRGTRGRLQVVKVRYDGFETTEEMLHVAVLEGSFEPLEQSDARSILEAELRTIEGLSANVSDEDLEEVLEEVLFMAEGDMSKRQEARFQQIVEQIETSMEDRLLLAQRQLHQVAGTVVKAEEKRDNAIGADVRTKAERKLKRLTERMSALESEVQHLRDREDLDYVRWMEQAHKRRSSPPVLETILDVEFELS
jgi:hypothetical protein